MCGEFGIPPSVALEEDYETVMTIMELRNYAMTKAAVEDENTDEDKLRKAGFSDRAITLVMENIETAATIRQAQGK